MALAIIGITAAAILLGGMVTLMAIIVFGANSKLRKNNQNDHNPDVLVLVKRTKAKPAGPIIVVEGTGEG